MPRSVIVGVLLIGVVAIIVAAAVISANVRYRLELEPPAQYNHRYAGSVDERVMPVAEVRTLCRSVGASGRFVACAWVSNSICHIICVRRRLCKRGNYDDEKRLGPTLQTGSTPNRWFRRMPSDLAGGLQQSRRV
jgi:hypothetical protein